MSEELSNYKLKCKKHIDLGIHHKVFTFVCLGIGIVMSLLLILIHADASWFLIFYPMGFVIVGWALFDLPQTLWHATICPDNPHWEHVEKWQAKNDTKVTYEQQLRNEEIEIAQHKRKTETII